jgi:hypothetical protein
MTYFSLFCIFFGLLFDFCFLDYGIWIVIFSL